MLTVYVCACSCIYVGVLRFVCQIESINSSNKRHFQIALGILYVDLNISQSNW